MINTGDIAIAIAGFENIDPFIIPSPLATIDTNIKIKP
jgi:hypothetical protein